MRPTEVIKANVISFLILSPFHQQEATNVRGLRTAAHFRNQQPQARKDIFQFIPRLLLLMSLPSSSPLSRATLTKEMYTRSSVYKSSSKLGLMSFSSDSYSFIFLLKIKNKK